MELLAMQFYKQMNILEQFTGRNWKENFLSDLLDAQTYSYQGSM